MRWVVAAVAVAASAAFAAPRRRGPPRAAALASARLWGGVAGLGAVAANRILLAPALAYGAQSRADLLAVAACAGLALDGLSVAAIDARPADPVALRGVRGAGVAASLSAADRATVEWAAKLALAASASIQTVFVYHRGATVLRRGVLGDANAVDANAPTFRDALAAGGTYVPDVQAVPARADFRYLPRNTQAALVAPFEDGALVVACDRKRALTPRDVAWLRQVAARLGGALVTPP